MRWVWPSLLLLVACSSDPTSPPDGDFAKLVGGAWIVKLADGRECFLLDSYHVPDLDEPAEAIAACRHRLDNGASAF